MRSRYPEIWLGNPHVSPPAPDAEAIRRWLTHTRGLPDDVLRANRIGADLGTQRQPRPILTAGGQWVLGWPTADSDNAGIPKVRRAAVVLPVLVDGRACYAQLRPLGWPGGPKYLHARGALAPNPRVGVVQPARAFDFPFGRRDELIVTEGIKGLVVKLILGVEVRKVKIVKIVAHNCNSTVHRPAENFNRPRAAVRYRRPRQP